MRRRLAVPLLAIAVLSAGCAGRINGTALAARTSAIGVAATSAPPTTTAAPTTTTTTPPPTTKKAPPPPAPPAPAGNPNGHAAIPAAAQPVDTSHPTRVIGSGTAASCTSQAVVAAVAAGGVVTFSCGPAPVTITLTATAKIRNTSTTVVLDGGGRVTLSGGGAHRILYQDTCDTAQGKVSPDCYDQAQPKLTVQNLTFANGNSTGQTTGDGGGGGAIFALGGRLTVINSRFENNRCDPTGPDLGGAGVRALNQYQNLPVYVVDSTFEGGACSNGGALSSIGVSWVVLNSVMSGNTAIGNGANPASPGTPGGGSGGAIYTDGDTYTLRIAGCLVQNNHANEGGGAVFYVSNDHTGTMSVESSTLSHNVSASFETAGFPGIFFIGNGKPMISGSTLTK
ncbi:MAG TPA: hypothetical protein VF892_15930 [Pseudonocardiaceae bacterium]